MDRTRKTITFAQRLAIVDWLRSGAWEHGRPPSELWSQDLNNRGWYVTPLQKHLRAMAEQQLFGPDGPDPDRITISVVRGILRDIDDPVARARQHKSARVRARSGERIEVVARSLKQLFDLLEVEPPANLIAVIDRKSVRHSQPKEDTGENGNQDD